MICSKENLAKLSSNPKAVELLASGSDLTGREWNRHVAGAIMDEFLNVMEGNKEDSFEFMQYTDVVVWIQMGMFDTAQRYLKAVVIPNLTVPIVITAARELADNLFASDDCPNKTIIEEPAPEE